MILVFLANGFEDTEAVCTIDILRRASLDVITVSLNDDRTVRSSHGIYVEADITAETLPECVPEMVVLPGGNEGTRNLACSGVVKRYINAANANGDYVAAICAAPTLLGTMGLLRGKTAVCYPGMESALDGAKLGNRIAHDGNIITAAGMGVTVDFALELVRTLVSDACAEKIKKQIIY